MPSALSNTASITLSPRDGVTPETLEKVGKWVGDQFSKGTIQAARCITEPSDRGVPHAHIAIYFTTALKVSDNYKDRLKSLLSEELEDSTNWGKPSIVCKAHNDFFGLVGGYYEKSDHQIIWTYGNISDEDLAKGGRRREKAIEAKKKRIVSKASIPELLLKTHNELIEETCNGSRSEQDHPDYAEYQPEVQLDMCLRRLLEVGYITIVMDIGPGKLKTLAKYWKSMTSGYLALNSRNPIE